ncbi:hypothetical protein HOS79_gp004 [Lactobacillus phage Nyseid]|uniref:Uncharacterized protein n=1 Tax=Lactobacillus phage Nyseid TaxID=2079432 RepID=A0A2K9VC74_9CAUD|nr:hypothetical protein HOS79_gp004 [Lactobacillus phage Nyseid]AUV59764.1 hypothetical protein [Lactobacillus phage Nyseid]
MDIKDLYNHREALQLIVNKTSDRLNTYDSKLNGLVPDDVRNTDDYKRDYKAYKQAFGNLQEFNKNLSRSQKIELRNIKRRLK